MEVEPYWARRYDLFSRWDSGIQTDKEGLFSVKPELIAMGIANWVSGQTIIDGFCGIGGITIALARSGHNVIAVDSNKNRLDMAKNNAKIYGVAGHIQFVHADIFDFLKKATSDTIVLDPDWGGPAYRKLKYFRLNDFKPNGRQLLEASLKATGNMVLCVPANFNIEEVLTLSKQFEYKKWKMWNRIICITIKFSNQ